MVKTNKRLFKRRVSTSEVVLINRTASLYLPPLRQFFTPRFYHIQGLHPHLLVTNIITCYHIHVFFLLKKNFYPQLSIPDGCFLMVLILMVVVFYQY